MPGKALSRLQLGSCISIAETFHSYIFFKRISNHPQDSPEPIKLFFFIFNAQEQIDLNI
jgi:hypothetical protein